MLFRSYERYGAQSDDEYFQEQMELDHRRREPDAFFQIDELNWPREGGNSKKERIERLEPDFRNGRFFLPFPLLHKGVPSTWRVDTDPASKAFGAVEYAEAKGMTRMQMDAISGGSADLVAKALVQRDDQTRYDLTAKFIADYSVYPFGRHDDLLDAKIGRAHV